MSTKVLDFINDKMGKFRSNHLICRGQNRMEIFFFFFLNMGRFVWFATGVWLWSSYCNYKDFKCIWYWCCIHTLFLKALYWVKGVVHLSGIKWFMWYYDTEHSICTTYLEFMTCERQVFDYRETFPTSTMPKWFAYI